MAVQWPLPAVFDDDLGHDHSQGDFGPLVVQRLYVVGQGRDGRPVRRDDDFEWQVSTPGLPVAVEARGFLFVGQVTDDKCPVSCLATGESTLLHSSKYSVWAVGGLLEYNFGPASLSVWATQEVSAKVSNPNALATIGVDPSVVTQGTTVFATLSYRLWAPEEPPKPTLYHK